MKKLQPKIHLQVKDFNLRAIPITTVEMIKFERYFSF